LQGMCYGEPILKVEDKAEGSHWAADDDADCKQDAQVDTSV